MSVKALIAAGATLIATAAQADVCSSLQQQYLAAGNGGRGGPDISGLQRSLAVAQNAAQANHCFGFSFFGPGPAPFCPQIMSEVNNLQAQIQQAGGRGGFFSVSQQPDRGQLRNLLVSNGCPVPGASDGGVGGGGGYRTLCVRTCDGYYFPMAYNASSGRFQADAQACQTMYGGAGNAQLFVMPSDGDVANATPVGGGKQYGSQPYAFSYRSAFNPSCAAQLQSGVAALEAKAAPGSAAPATAGATTATATSDPVPLPKQRPVRFEDPETTANLAGNLRPSSAETLVASRAGASGVRVVGAGYYNQILEQQDARLTNNPAISDADPSTLIN